MPFTTNIASLNDNTFSELQSSLLLTIGNGVTSTGGGSYQVSPNGVGLATYDGWIGVLGSPDPSDTIQYNTFIPATSTPGVVQYTTTSADGAVSPASGGIGAEVVGWNATGVLLEQLTGYVPGPSPIINADGEFLVLVAPSVDLSVTDGSGGATTAELTFGTTGAFPTFAVPEPSTMLLMPLLVITLMVSRIPAVRSFLAAL
jgi:hypothetical protein